MPITVSGTAITFNDATTQTTAFTGGGGTVTSVATGNGLQGGTITTSGTLSVACPGFNTVGSYVMGGNGPSTGKAFTSGTNYGVGTGTNQLTSICTVYLGADLTINNLNNLSGTWKWMAATTFDTGAAHIGIICRVS